jgi:Tfp pilus assembly protein PilZ
MSTSEEQPRQFARYEVNAYVDLAGEAATRVGQAQRVQNISLGGICIQAGAGVAEVGTIVDLVINFPDLDARVSLRGQIVWVNREPPVDIGVQYVDLDAERKDLLRRYIKLVRRA